MSRNQRKDETQIKTRKGSVQLSNLEDLIILELKTIEDVANGIIDNQKADLIFTGVRGLTGTLKVSLEAMRMFELYVGKDVDGSHHKQMKSLIKRVLPPKE